MSASRAEPAPVPLPVGAGGDPLAPDGLGLGRDAAGERAVGRDATRKDRRDAEPAKRASAGKPASDRAASKALAPKLLAPKPLGGKPPAVKSPATKPPAAKPPAAKSVGWALVQAARLHRARIGDRLAMLNLFAGQEQVVQALAVSGSMTMGDLAATLRVRPPTASKTISRLAALGFVERRAEAGDGRVVRVRLTETGLAKAAAIQRLWDEVEAELLDGFEGKERRRLRKLLRKAAGNLAEAAGVAGHEPEPEIDDEAEPGLAATARLPGEGG